MSHPPFLATLWSRLRFSPLRSPHFDVFFSSFSLSVFGSSLRSLIWRVLLLLLFIGAKTLAVSPLIDFFFICFWSARPYFYQSRFLLLASLISRQVGTLCFTEEFFFLSVRSFHSLKEIKSFLRHMKMNSLKMKNVRWGLHQLSPTVQLLR